MVMESFQNDDLLFAFEVPLSPEYNYENEQIKINTLSRLGFEMLPGRRIRLGLETYQGVTLPKNLSKQLSLTTRCLTWYGPCLKPPRQGYHLNCHCFPKREKGFLKLLSEGI